MPDWRERSSGSCCADPWYEQTSIFNEGDRVEAFAECQNCGAEWRDVFRYSHAEVKPRTLPDQEADDA